jgi:hypothetical protein
MIDSSSSYIASVSVHHIGNRTKQEDIKITEEPLDIVDDKLHQLLRTYFLSNFSIPEYHSFTFSNEDFKLNPIYQFALSIFNDPDTFHINSIHIAKHLYEATQHPNIKAGDLYVAHITDLALDGIRTEALGIFKSENKESYLKLKAYANQFDLHADEGINIRKLDKGCLIFNEEQENGFRVLIVDNSNKSDAQFWKHDFLNVKPLSDSFHLTHNFMNLTRQYVAEQIQEEFSVSKADQIDLLNRSVHFFKSKEHFNQAEFETEVLGDAEVIESFRSYGKSFLASHQLDPVDQFEISAQAVKRQARVFKSVLKLDKNFHIYIHGNRDLIEKGYDEVMGKHYYKLYFDEES